MRVKFISQWVVWVVMSTQIQREEWLKWIREAKYVIESKYRDLIDTAFYTFYRHLIHLEEMLTLTGITPSVFADMVLYLDAAMKTYLKHYDLPPMPQSLLEYARSV
jgi:hypothetical protein